MATRTLVNNPTTVKNYGNSGNAYTFTQEVIQNATGDPATNKTSITVNLYIQGINGYSYNGFTTPKAAIYIQGIKMKEVVVGAVTTSKVKYCSIDYDLPHLDDGTQTLKVKTTYNPNTTSYSFLPASYTYESTTTMTAIPRKSTMSLSSTSITTLGSTTATITTRNRNFTHTITTYYNGLYTLASDKTGASPTATITIPAGLRQRMAQNGVSSATLTLSLNTYNGNTLLGTNDYSLSISAPDPVITVSPASVRCNSATTTWTLTNYDTYLLNYAVTRTCGSKSYTDLARTEGFISTRSNLANALFEQALPNNTKGTVTVSVTSYIKNTSTAVKTVTQTYEVTIPTGTYKPTISLVTNLAVRQITPHGTRNGIAYFAGLDGASGVVSESINGSSRIDTRSVTISYNGINSTETVGETSVSGSNVTIYAPGATKAWPASASNYTATVTYTVTDKRGTPASYSFTAVTVSGYFKPVINASVERATSSGVADPEGTSANVTVAASTAVSTGGTLKTIEVKVENTTPIASNNNSNTLNARPATGTYLTNAEYSINVIATDNINLSTTATVILPKIAVALSLHKNNGVGLGTIATQGRITNGLPLYLKDPVYINHQGDVKGSSFFDGHTNITENLWIPYCRAVRINAGNGEQYHRIATIGEIATDYYDASAILLLDMGFRGGGWGIARIILRTNTITGWSQRPDAEVHWLARSSSMPINRLQYGLYNNSGKATLDIYYYRPDPYQSCIVRKLETYRGNIVSGRWTLLDSNATGTGASSTNTTIVEVYNGVNRISYTSTGIASDVGVTAVSSKLGTSTLGDEYTPIALNSGAPATTNSFLRVGTSTPLSSSTGHNTVNGEVVFKNSQYAPDVGDTASGIGCANKGSRYLINELLVDGIVAPPTAYSRHSMSTAASTIQFYKYTGTTSGGQWTGLTKTAYIDTSGAYHPQVSRTDTYMLAGLVGVAISTTQLRVQIPVPSGYSDFTPALVSGQTTANLDYNGTDASFTFSAVAKLDMNPASVSVTLTTSGLTAYRVYGFRNGRVSITLT